MKYLLQLLVITIVLIVTSCASEVSDIDRTQPNKIKKSFFNGEWYMRTTIVDVPFATGFTFIGEQGETTLVQWDVQEKYLIAYRTYEHNPGNEAYLQGNKTFGTVCSKGEGENEELKVLGYNQDCPDGYELKSKESFYGTPVAAYTISKHFDVKRQYNSSTGEQTNVITENTSDRNWYDRDYMRVNWGKNLIPDFRFGSPNSIPQQGVNFYCSDLPKGVDPYCDEWAPTFDEENGYMAIVTKILAQPETFDYYGTKYPTCYLNASQDCLGQEITVKTDFMRKTDKQYAEKAVNYDEMKMQKFGYFRTEKYVYDRDRGFLEGAKKYYANVFDIFEKDENGEYTGVVKPIVYYVNKDFPPELWEAAEWLAKGKVKDLYDGSIVHRLGWNDVYQDLAREVLGAKYTGEDMFIMCHNPVTENDNAKCGEIGLSPKIGDLRYNIVFWVANPQASSPLGYGPLAADPLTGRTISANAFVYGNALEWYAQYVLELVDLVNGTIDVDDYISGRYIADYLKNQNLVATNMTFNKSVGDKFLDKKFDINAVNKFAETKLSDRIQGVRAAIKDGKLNSTFQDRLDRVKGTEIDKAMMDKNLKALIDPSKGFVEGDTSEGLSSIDIMSSRFIKREDELKRILAKKTIMMNDFNESSMLAFAKFIANKMSNEGWTKDEAFLFIKKEIFYGTTIHEIGHNLGLRHNFASHTDSLNFFEEYWDIRIGDASQLDPANGLLPRYRETKERFAEQMAKGIVEYQYTSIMDYGGRTNTDFQGLGSYDKAAIMFAYGNKVQVFDNADARAFKYSDKLDNKASEVYRTRHYSRILYKEGMKGGFAMPIASDYVNNKELNLEFLYGHRKWMDYDKVLFTKDDQEVKDDSSLYLKDKANDDLGNSDGFVEVPYAFCSDEYHSGTYKCYRFAMGVDMYESVIHQEEYFDNWYFITNFKKGRSFFSENSGGYQNRVYGRLDFIANQFKHWLYEGWIARDPNDGWALGSDTSIFEGEDLTVAAVESFNFFTKVLGSVDPGFYTLNADNQYELTREKDYLNNWDEAANVGEKEIPLGVGKYQDTIYDEDFGYYYYYTPVVQGVWLDKLLALFVLGDDMTNFMGVDASADSLSFAISYTSIFTEDVMRVVAGLILDRPQYYAPFYYNGEYHNPIGILSSDNSMGTGLLGDFTGTGIDALDGNDELYANHKDEFQYIKSSNSYFLKYRAIVLAFAYFSSVSGLDFVKSLEINAVDNGDSYTPTEFDDLDQSVKDGLIAGSGGDEAIARSTWESHLEIVVDPLSKRTYFAANMFSASGNSATALPKISIAYELLKDFKVLVDQYNLTKAAYDADQNDTALYEAFDSARRALREKRDYIDLVAKMMYYFKHHDY